MTEVTMEQLKELRQGLRFVEFHPKPNVRVDELQQALAAPFLVGVMDDEEYWLIPEVAND